ncbi:MAG TPA: hypothetical protein VJT31_16455, partial [Rugosimonospora sp.]|nr:hypothetical protein [Rugosimonospora sp.]
LAVAVLGAGGPPEDAGWTVRYIVSDRLGNNLISLLLLPVVTATVGWAGAAAAAPAAARLRPATAAISTGGTHPVGPPAVVPDWRRIARFVLVGIVILAALLMAALSWHRG